MQVENSEWYAGKILVNNFKYTEKLILQFIYIVLHGDPITMSTSRQFSSLWGNFRKKGMLGI